MEISFADTLHLFIMVSSYLAKVMFQLTALANASNLRDGVLELEYNWAETCDVKTPTRWDPVIFGEGEMKEFRTGCPVFTDLWSYVLTSLIDDVIY